MGTRLVVGHGSQLKYAAINTKDGNFTLPFFACAQYGRAGLALAATAIVSSSHTRHCI
jgi:hypothetical protein